MNILESIILGVVQGLTEFIPVSSSGHLELVPKFFNWSEPSTSYITFLHFGTLLALLLYYRKKLLKYVISFVKYLKKESGKEEKADLVVLRNIIIATIPAGILGFFLGRFIESIYDNPENTRMATLFTAVAMIVVGVVFLFSNRLFANNKLNIDKLGANKALFIGIAQALALFRGTSRSGITLLAGQFAGLDRVSAAEFGFLMSIPVTLAAAALGTIDIIQDEGVNLVNNLPVYLAGLLSSFIFGYLAITFMISFLKKRGLRDFGIYRIIFGLIVLVVLL